MTLQYRWYACLNLSTLTQLVFAALVLILVIRQEKQSFVAKHG
jgi:hypothetical protein